MCYINVVIKDKKVQYVMILTINILHRLKNTKKLIMLHQNKNTMKNIIELIFSLTARPVKGSILNGLNDV
jgi:hypothetical protein